MADAQTPQMYTGTVTLTNTKMYPFNDSLRTVMLERRANSCDYTVLTKVLSADGEAGEIVVSGKAVNGFKLAFTGSASKAVIRYCVIGECDCHDGGTDGGTPVTYAFNGMVLSIGGILTVDLTEYQHDYPVTLDISADTAGRIVLGQSHRYVAQVFIPARTYQIERGAADDFGFPKLRKTALPMDTGNVTVTLWALGVQNGTV